MKFLSEKSNDLDSAMTRPKDCPAYLLVPLQKTSSAWRKIKMTTNINFTYSFSELPVVCTRDVLGINEGDNARHGKCLGGIDPDHGGIGLAGEHKGAVELVLPLRDVPYVLGLSGRLPLGLHLLYRLADRPKRFVGLKVLLPAGEASLQCDVIGTTSHCWGSRVAQDVEEELRIRVLEGGVMLRVTL